MTTLNGTDYEYLTTLYFNSDDRNNNQPLNNFVLNYNNNLITCDLLGVIRYQFTNQIYPITSYNNYYYYSYNAIFYSYYIPEGNYTAQSLASLIQTQMRTQTTDNTITFTYNSTTSKFQYYGSQVWQMLAAPYQPPPVIPSAYQLNNCGMVFGLRIDDKDVTNYNSAIVPALTTYSFPYPVDITYTKYIDVASAYLTQYNRPVGSSSSQTQGRTLTRIHTNTQAFGTEQYIKIKNLLFYKWANEQPLGGQIDIQIYDDRGRPALINNSRFNFEIACYRKK